MTENDRERNIPSVAVNGNFHKKEFMELWDRINRKSVYTVQFDSDELVRKCIGALDADLRVPSVRYAVKHDVVNETFHTDVFTKNTLKGQLGRNAVSGGGLY